MIMVVYFLVLYGWVGFIQDKKFFSSAPKENLEAIPYKKERFRGLELSVVLQLTRHFSTPVFLMKWAFL